MDTSKALFEKYQVIIVHKGDGFRAVVRELNLVATGADVSTACAVLSQKFEDLRRDLSEAGFEDEFPASGQKGVTGRFPAWMLKTAAAVGAVLIVMFVFSLTFNASVNRVEVAADRVSQTISVRTLLVKLRKELLQMADAPADRKKEIAMEVRQFVSASKPILEELWLLLPPSQISIYPSIAGAPAQPKNQ